MEGYGGSVMFDHVAVAVRRWSDGYPWFVSALGGRWVLGADAGEFAPAQLEFHGGMRVELLEAGSRPDGFVARFLAQSGPGPHHITFYVDDLDGFVGRCVELGIDAFAWPSEVPGRREALIHPKSAGLGTLVQIVQSTGLHEGATPPPDDLPEPAVEQRELVWVALRVAALDRAEAVFVAAIGGCAVRRGDGPTGPWSLLEWGPGRRLLLAPSGERPTGVDHVRFAAPGADLPDPSTGLAADAMFASECGLKIVEVSHVID